jgi:uncharacterized protein (DUF427 family)
VHPYRRPIGEWFGSLVRLVIGVTKPHLEPSADHPITITPATERVRVMSGDQLVADTTSALRLQEASYPPVFYVPLSDVDADSLRRSDASSYCPYKGDASYYSVVTPAGEVADAVWEYQHPHPAVAAIEGHVAFYTDRLDVAVG